MSGTESVNPVAKPVAAVDLSVIIPCFNEAENIEGLIREWSHFLNAELISFEVIVVNDGSTDGTGRVLDRLRREMKNMRVIHQLNLGHGRAIRRGYECARGTHVLQVDASGRYETSDFLRLWEHRDRSPLILAYRTHRLDKLPRRLMAHLLRKFVKLLFRLPVQDPNVPFRIFRREAATPYLAQLPQGLISVNLSLTLLMKLEFPHSVAEVPVPFRQRAKGASHHKVATLMLVGTHILIEMVRLRVSLLRLKIAVPTANPVGT